MYVNMSLPETSPQAATCAAANLAIGTLKNKQQFHNFLNLMFCKKVTCNKFRLPFRHNGNYNSPLWATVWRI